MFIALTPGRLFASPRSRQRCGPSAPGWPRGPCPGVWSRTQHPLEKEKEIKYVNGGGRVLSQHKYGLTAYNTKY